MPACQYREGRASLSLPPLSVSSPTNVLHRTDSVRGEHQFLAQAVIARAETVRDGSYSATTPVQALSRHDEEHLVNLYYSHFHRTHPVLLPRNRYGGPAFPIQLRLVIQLIGSRYASGFERSVLQSDTDTALAGTPERSVCGVQSLLLYAICLHADAEHAEAVSVLARASALAIELGLNRVDYATTHGKQDPLVEESLRRSWWELYVVDGFFAALHRQTTFTCNTVELAAELPCEDNAYRQGMQPAQPVTLEQFDMRFFAAADQLFASACYRIEAIRIMARVLAVSEGENGPDDIQAVDNAIAAWKLHLPRAKASVVDQRGEVDQVLLQAHTFIYTARIILHFPRSELPLKVPTATDISCAARMCQASPTSAQHSIKAISASKDMSDLAGLPVGQHSPLFICSLVFGCIVQLSACSAHTHDCTMQHRDRVALMIGMLKCLGHHWAIATEVVRHLNKIASGVFMPQKTSADTPLLDNGLDMDAILNSGMWLDLFPALATDRGEEEGAEA